MKRRMIVALGALCGLVACAESPDAVRASYASSAAYANMSCQQLVAEAHNVSNAAHDAAGVQRRHRTQDAIATTAGLVVFWPALLFIHGNDSTTSEIGQLKGQMQAIEAASTAKKCGLVFQRV
ncbi:hypothetical protein [Paracoccus denitrificans]|uniref:hypothetical protein n=1 Tax=Paracoccus denitrificans TaxID=266 RepID=UPI000CEC84F3|nr:hypothetical protein [Paracoccus denitrificans]UFS67176.1 hypothetical protein LO749_13680 [Paracoccus denitrificans]